jgi:hypothetical protein
MFLVISLFAPLLLLGLLLVMERVERPLRVYEVSEEVERFVAAARPDEIETFVTTEYGSAVDRYWRRAGRRTGRASYRRRAAAR